MIRAWLDIVGIGEDGMAGLSAEARCCVENAQVIVGGDRHHRLSEKVSAERIAWPSPFAAMIGVIRGYRGKRLVILVTGDPLWYSVGAKITKSIPAQEIRFHPQLSAFQWAACRLGWSLADAETLTVHGRPAGQIIPYFSPGARLLVLTKNRESPAEIAAMLTERGYGASRLTVLAALGGPHEARFDATAQSWGPQVPDFHLLAVECIAGSQTQVWPRTGLPDHAFRHDGKLTKQVVRAVTLARLAPVRDAILWDIGAGCGSIGIEWMRAAPEARAIAIEPLADRREMAQHNALVLGAPALRLIDGRAPAALAGLPAPDAVFIGGGVTAANVTASIEALKPFGRLVTNAVTLESETVLAEMHAAHGGELSRISTQVLAPVGDFHGWKPAMPVTQWFLTKGAER
jgi:precorrin-6B C5,15-methyltransferase / cobalt-precorrin-6B C5,C15-methyltransferase